MTGDEAFEILGNKMPPYHPRCRTTIVASFDVTARTTKEAEQIAKNTFGVDADYGGKENLKLANHINQGLLEAKEKAMPMPEKVLFDSRLTKKIFGRNSDDVPASFLEPKYEPDNKKTILVNEKSSYWKDPVKSAESDYGKDENGNRWASTKMDFHVLLHELTHLEHYSKNEKLYRRNKQFKDKNVIEKITKTISQRASFDRREFVAELKVGLIDGQKYDEKMMKLYKKYGGIE